MKKTIKTSALMLALLVSAMLGACSSKSEDVKAFVSYISSLTAQLETATSVEEMNAIDESSVERLNEFTKSTAPLDENSRQEIAEACTDMSMATLQLAGMPIPSEFRPEIVKAFLAQLEGCETLGDFASLLQNNGNSNAGGMYDDTETYYDDGIVDAEVVDIDNQEAQ